MRREDLEARRAEAVERLSAAEADFVRIVEAAESVSTDDEHDPDGAGLAVTRAQIVAIIGQARDHVERLDRAMDRLAAGSYHRCERCGGVIAAERLEARPSASTCIDCAT